MTPESVAPFAIGPLLPIVALVVAALVVLLLEAFVPASRKHVGWVAVVALVLATAGASSMLGGAAGDPFPGMFAADAYGYLFDMLFFLAALAAIGLSLRWHPELGRAEYYALLLLAAAGMSALGHAANLVTVFLALELLSIVLYALTGFLNGRQRSAEAALKYFFLGAFASGFVVFGIALVYGATGSFDLATIGQRVPDLASQPAAMALLAGVAMLLVGFSFEISAVPFHMWTPDVYEGAPTPVAAFMSVGTKAAAFAALLRLFAVGFGGFGEEWKPVVAGLAVATMLVGNLVALRQLKLKRMLAYSSIAHAGYGLVGLVAWDQGGASATVFYMVAYAAMNLGAFGLVAALERDGQGLVLPDLNGLARRRPLVAAALALCLLSLAGVPPTAGFVGKFALFLAAVDAGWVKLAVVAVLYSAIAAYYYLRPIVHMYMEPRAEGALELSRLSPAATLVVVAAVAGVLFLGLLPGGLLEVVEQAVAGLL